MGEPAVSALFEPLFKALNVPEAAMHGISIAIGFIIITALHIVVGELIPKSLAIFSTERYALFTATPLVWFYRITYPVMWLFNSITNGVMKMLGHDVANEHEVYTDEEIKKMAEEKVVGLGAPTWYASIWKTRWRKASRPCCSTNTRATRCAVTARIASSASCT